MADDSLDVREPLKFEATTRPYGTYHGYDLEALSTDQQAYINRIKLYLIKDQHCYMAKHPEVGAICKLLLSECLYKKPKFVHKFAAEFCKDTYRGESLKKRVDRYLDMQRKSQEKAERLSKQVFKEEETGGEEEEVKSFSSEDSKNKARYRFAKEVQKMRSFLRTFPPKEPPSRMHLTPEYYEKLQRMLRDLSRVHPTYKYTKKDEYQFTYEHVCKLLGMDLRQLGFVFEESDITLESLAPCGICKIGEEEEEKEEEEVEEEEDQKPEKKKVSKCYLCFNCIDSESPGFDHGLCAQCWFWHHAKEALPEEEETRVKKKLGIDEVPLSPCDSCASCLLPENLSLEKEEELIEVEEKPIKKEKVPVPVVKHFVEEEKKEKKEVKKAQEVVKKKPEKKEFIQHVRRPKMELSEMIRLWIKKWEKFLAEIEQARAQGIIGEESFLNLRYFGKRHLGEEEDSEDESVEEKELVQSSDDMLKKVSKEESVESVKIESPDVMGSFEGEEETERLSELEEEKNGQFPSEFVIDLIFRRHYMPHLLKRLLICIH